MKKIMLLIICVAMCATLMACTQKEPEQSDISTQNTFPQTEQNTLPQNEPTTTNPTNPTDSNIVVEPEQTFDKPQYTDRLKLVENTIYDDYQGKMRTVLSYTDYISSYYSIMFTTKESLVVGSRQFNDQTNELEHRAWKEYPTNQYTLLKPHHFSNHFAANSYSPNGTYAYYDVTPEENGTYELKIYDLNCTEDELIAMSLADTQRQVWRIKNGEVIMDKLDEGLNIATSSVKKVKTPNGRILNCNRMITDSYSGTSFILSGSKAYPVIDWGERLPSILVHEKHLPNINRYITNYKGFYIMESSDNTQKFFVYAIDDDIFTYSQDFELPQDIDTTEVKNIHVGEHFEEDTYAFLLETNDGDFYYTECLVLDYNFGAATFQWNYLETMSKLSKEGAIRHFALSHSNLPGADIAIIMNDGYLYTAND